jgi:hypothetical protein
MDTDLAVAKLPNEFSNLYGAVGLPGDGEMSDRYPTSAQIAEGIQD